MFYYTKCLNKKRVGGRSLLLLCKQHFFVEADVVARVFGQPILDAIQRLVECIKVFLLMPILEVFLVLDADSPYFFCCHSCIYLKG